jgi:TetR/AcrR family transcriptional regulator, transcriptional repressor for nem operon
MRYPVEETAEKHQRILEQAAQQLRERGLSKVSVADVMKAAGLTHGAFYNHFQSKDDLIAKSVEHASSIARENMAESERSREGLSAYVDSYLSRGHRDQPGSACLISTLGAEISREPAARPAFTDHVRGVLQSLTKSLRLSKTRTARGDAIRLLSGMVGAIILARGVNDEELSDEILREARKLLE